MISHRQADLLNHFMSGLLRFNFEYDSQKWEIYVDFYVDNPQTTHAKVVHNLAVGAFLDGINQIIPFDRQIEGTGGNRWVVRFGQTPVTAQTTEHLAGLFYAELLVSMRKHFEVLERTKGLYSGWVKYKYKPEY